MPDVFTANKATKPTVNPAKKTADSPFNFPTDSPNLFTAYCKNPQGISFINQEPDENIVLFLRRHFITNFGWIFLAVLFLILPPAITALINISNIVLFQIPPQLTLVITLFYYLLVLNYAFVKFITWFYHVGIVTQKRLIDLDIDNILHYHLAETNLADVVDVSHSQKGFFQSFFNYGDVPIQTEALKANFLFEKAPHPAEVADIITDLRPDGKGEK